MKISIFFLLFLFLSSCTDEYSDHLRREHTPILSATASTLSDTKYTLVTLPDTGALEDIVENIDNATDRIWLEIYTWTERETLEAALRAKKR